MATNRIAIISGARPNFMKIAPLCVECKKKETPYFIVNTGQHFSDNMSKDFFKEFGVRPDYNLSPSQDSVVRQFSDIANHLEDIFKKERPTLVVVVGDVNSTLIASIVARKMDIRLAHVESGLRSYNRKMPEEINRIIVDHISDILLAPSEDATLNLAKEGLTENVFLVGNIMIDTLTMFLPNIKSSEEDFFFCTLHRSENIDDMVPFGSILDALEVISKDKKIYFPIHPRTKKMAAKFKFLDRINRIFSTLPPISYKESLFYQKNAKLVLTDSGGIQEETSFLGTPCITLRSETERPITLELGTNTIGGVSKESILSAYRGKKLEKKETHIPLWDGYTSNRILEAIKLYVEK